MATMEQTTEQVSEEQTQAPPPTTEIFRPVEGRMIAGVAQGLANRFGLPVWLVRIGFIVTAFAGGLGIAAYGAGWALLRSEDEAQTPAERFLQGDRSASSWIGIGLILIAGLILLGSFSFFSGKVLFAIGLVAVGVLLYTGHFPMPSGSDHPDDGGDSPAPGAGTDHKEGVQQVTTTHDMHEGSTETTGVSPAGSPTPPHSPAPPVPTPPDLPPVAPRERSILGRLTLGVMLLGLGVLAILDSVESIPIDADPRHYMALAVTILGVGLLVGSVVGRARWLIVVGAILIPTLIFSPVFEYDWDSEAFDTFVAPTSFNELDGGYSIDIGNMVIDLTDLDWNGETVELAATADIGNIEIRVPADVGLDGLLTANVGRVSWQRGSSFGFGDPRVVLERDGTEGHLSLDADIDIGNIEVVDR
jgi:phage shock protein PspC (stress-responsive transcriptional regulator)